MTLPGLSDEQIHEQIAAFRRQEANPQPWATAEDARFEIGVREAELARRWAVSA